MNKKIWWGLIVILVGLFYLLQQYIPEAARYILNYQVLFILIGIFFSIKNKKRQRRFLLISSDKYMKLYLVQLLD